MYKITFNFITPIAFIDLPIFDSIICNLIYKEKYKTITDYTTTGGAEIKENMLKIFEIFPITKNKNGFYECSYLNFNHKIESIATWRKRWHNKDDRMVDFKGTKKRIHTGSGLYKNYEMPLIINSIHKGWFYFNGDAKKIEQLVEDYLVGVGKKVKYGYGWFNSFTITKELTDLRKLFFRPLPPKQEYVNLFKSLVLSTGNILPPYWMPTETKILKPQ